MATRRYVGILIQHALTRIAGDSSQKLENRGFSFVNLPEDSKDDAFLVAHEIEHVIRWFSGQYLDIKIDPYVAGCFEEVV